MYMLIIMPFITGCAVSAGLAIDPANEQSKLYGTIRAERVIDDHAVIYFEHISDPTTREDGYGLNLIGVSGRVKF
jgi:hypothetical protein